MPGALHQQNSLTINSDTATLQTWTEPSEILPRNTGSISGLLLKRWIAFKLKLNILWLNDDHPIKYLLLWRQWPTFPQHLWAAFKSLTRIWTHNNVLFNFFLMAYFLPSIFTQFFFSPLNWRGPFLNNVCVGGQMFFSLLSLYLSHRSLSFSLFKKKKKFSVVTGSCTVWMWWREHTQLSVM